MSTENNSDKLYNDSIKILSDLIGFKTISGGDNNSIINYCEKIFVFKAGYCLGNSSTGYELSSKNCIKFTGWKCDRDRRGHSYFIVRGKILGFLDDERKRKHLSGMFSLIKDKG